MVFLFRPSLPVCPHSPPSLSLSLSRTRVLRRLFFLSLISSLYFLYACLCPSVQMVWPTLRLTLPSNHILNPLVANSAVSSLMSNTRTTGRQKTLRPAWLLARYGAELYRLLRLRKAWVLYRLLVSPTWAMESLFPISFCRHFQIRHPNQRRTLLYNFSLDLPFLCSRPNFSVYFSTSSLSMKQRHHSELCLFLTFQEHVFSSSIT